MRLRFKVDYHSTLDASASYNYKVYTLSLLTYWADPNTASLSTPIGRRGGQKGAKTPLVIYGRTLKSVVIQTTCKAYLSLVRGDDPVAHLLLRALGGAGGEAGEDVLVPTGGPAVGRRRGGRAHVQSLLPGISISSIRSAHRLQCYRTSHSYALRTPTVLLGYNVRVVKRSS